MVIACGGLRCLVTLNLHGEGGAQDLQWWYLCGSHDASLATSVVSWCYDGVVA